jgi:SAM-dependent methyltransferase
VVHEAASVGFSRSAEAYDRARPDYPDAAVDRLFGALALSADSFVIDVGAGTGKLTAPLAARGAEVLAIEPVEEMRARIGARAPAARALEGVAERLPEAAGAADAVVAGQAFHWFANERALAEFARVLKPAGRLGLIWNRRAPDDPLQARITELLEPLRGDAPRHAAGAWRDIFDASAPFERADAFELEFIQDLDREGLVDRVGSISFVAALKPARRARVLADVAALAPDVGSVGLGYVCEAFVYARRRV